MTDETRMYLKKMRQCRIDEFNKDVKYLSMDNEGLKKNFDRGYTMLVIRDIQSHLAIIDAISKELEG